MYDRDGARHQHRIGSYLHLEKDIAEEDEGEATSTVSNCN